MIAGRGLARIESGSKQGVTYLWLVGNGRMVVIVVITLHSLLTKGKTRGYRQAVEEGK